MDKMIPFVFGFQRAKVSIEIVKYREKKKCRDLWSQLKENSGICEPRQHAHASNLYGSNQGSRGNEKKNKYMYTCTHVYM